MEEELLKLQWMKLVKFVKVNMDNDETRLAAGNWLLDTDAYPAFQIYRHGRLVSQYFGSDKNKFYDIIKAWN
jgi:hypothetical protein